jgi:hypothetical protein
MLLLLTAENSSRSTTAIIAAERQGNFLVLAQQSQLLLLSDKATFLSYTMDLSLSLKRELSVCSARHLILLKLMLESPLKTQARR